ncbi:hypothetical protein DMB38_13225 [Streptomyces sp. WAC 06738]|uniref:hypothetical protein n=1 Tax=Streptomyces sp. WAC 06738 TaxID=2203210 RepID=UPI000F6C2488|nr:hypothetical protein [Streptomyces sp. WAC 06738]AZM46641.1 hypothetical protein DMB38_13225 [Streptomyces sp. WAC 06738]
MAENLYLAIDFGRNGGSGEDRGTERPWNRTDPPFWASSSIWVDPGGTEAHTGEPTVVKVRVSNRSNQTVKDVAVQAWAFVPQVGVINTPGNAKVSFRSPTRDVAPGSGTLSNSDPHVFTCLPEWTPTEADLPAGETELHMCIMANAFQDPAVADPPPPGEKLDGKEWPSGDEVLPNGDGHVGQRNITLKKVPRAAASEPVHVPYHTYPPQPPPHGPFLREFLVTTTTVTPRDVLGPDEYFVLAGVPEIGAPERGKEQEQAQPELMLRTSYGTEPVRPGDGRLSFELQAEGIPGLDRNFVPPESPAQSEYGEKGIPSELLVTLESDPVVGSVHSFDVTLNDAEEGTVIGAGLRVMVLITE